MNKLLQYLISYIKKKIGKDNNVRTPDLYYYKMWEENLTLAKQYEKEYNFEKALLHCRLAYNSFNKELEIQAKQGLDMNYLTPTKIYESQLLVKMNKLDEAISVLNTSKRLSIYKTDKQYKYAIDMAIADIVRKKEKGYIYKPRPRSKDTQK